MTAIPGTPALARESAWKRHGTALVFAGAVAVMLVAWALLAVVYGHVTHGSGPAGARRVVEAVTSNSATVGNQEVRALIATPEYFAVDQRSAAYFGTTPERSLQLQAESERYFDTFNRDAASLAVDPDRYIPILLMVDLHEGRMADPEQWVDRIRLTRGDTAQAPLHEFTVAFRSDHHQTLALQFPRVDASGRAFLDGQAGALSLEMPRLDDVGNVTVGWQLPLRFPPPDSNSAGAAATLGTFIAVVAGLLVVFSPCAVHMTAYFLPLVTGLGMREILDRKEDTGFRAYVVSLGLAFVSGFVVLYTLFGIGAGFAGQLLSDTTRFEPYLAPLRIVTGSVVIFMAMQTLGVFRLPFAMRLMLPRKPLEHRARSGYLAAAISGMSISVGCFTCVGGSLLATMLLFAGASSSPVLGGLTLFLFSTGMSMPFLLAAVAFDRVVPRFTRAHTLLRSSTTLAGAMMVVVGLLIMSGNESVFERLVFRAL